MVDICRARGQLRTSLFLEAAQLLSADACDVSRINKCFTLKVRSRDLISSTSAASLLDVLPQLTFLK